MKTIEQLQREYVVALYSHTKPKVRCAFCRKLTEDWYQPGPGEVWCKQCSIFFLDTVLRFDSPMDFIHCFTEFVIKHKYMLRYQI